MKIEELKNKIPEVCAAARVIVQHYGHTKKFAKHIVALVVKQIKRPVLSERASICNIY